MELKVFCDSENISNFVTSCGIKVSYKCHKDSADVYLISKHQNIKEIEKFCKSSEIIVLLNSYKQFNNIPQNKNIHILHFTESDLKKEISKILKNIYKNKWETQIQNKLDILEENVKKLK